MKLKPKYKGEIEMSIGIILFAVLIVLGLMILGGGF